MRDCVRQWPFTSPKPSIAVMHVSEHEHAWVVLLLSMASMRGPATMGSYKRMVSFPMPGTYYTGSRPARGQTHTGAVSSRIGKIVGSRRVCKRSKRDSATSSGQPYRLSGCHHGSVESIDEALILVLFPNDNMLLLLERREAVPRG